MEHMVRHCHLPSVNKHRPTLRSGSLCTHTQTPGANAHSRLWPLLRPPRLVSPAGGRRVHGPHTPVIYNGSLAHGRAQTAVCSVKGGRDLAAIVCCALLVDVNPFLHAADDGVRVDSSGAAGAGVGTGGGENTSTTPSSFATT